MITIILDNKNKWEFDVSVQRELMFRADTLLHLFRYANLVKLNDETVKDRHDVPQRRLTQEDWKDLGLW